MLKDASLWASTFAHINWLCQFYLAIPHPNFPSSKQIAETLNICWGWDEEIAKVFWDSGRNPIAHVGQGNPFFSFAKYKGLRTSVSLNSGSWSDATTKEWNTYHPYTGISLLPSPPPTTGNEPEYWITFFHQMLLDELLPTLAQHVSTKIRNETDPELIEKILKINSQIPH